MSANTFTGSPLKLTGEYRQGFELDDLPGLEMEDLGTVFLPIEGEGLVEFSVIFSPGYEGEDCERWDLFSKPSPSKHMISIYPA